MSTPNNKTYTIRFVTSKKTYEVFATEGESPTVPEEASADDGALHFATWDRPLSKIHQNETYRAIYTELMEGDAFCKYAWNVPQFLFPSDPESADNPGDTMEHSLSFLLLLFEEHKNPQPPLAERIADNLIALCSSDYAPNFDVCCLWSYLHFTMAIALARVTPSVRSLLPEGTKRRLDLIMRVFAYHGAFATADENDFGTGPRMGGNYRKSWAPNYRLANVPNILFCAHYFGEGDMKRGAQIVNAMLHAFDEKVYEELMEAFRRYGYARALSCWTHEGPLLEDGTRAPDAKTLLLHGGAAHSKNTWDPTKISPAGSGVGVTLGGLDYRYHGFSIAQSEKIIEELIDFVFSGGKVKSDHWYDIEQNGTLERISYIADESHSPYEGEDGMMQEFSAGIRSSTVYCSTCFKLAIPLLYTADLLGMLKNEGDTLWKKTRVGTDDFLYKNERGYICCAHGSYGLRKGNCWSEQNERKGYFALKSFWYTTLRDAILKA